MSKSSTSVKIHFDINSERPMIWRRLSNNHAWAKRRFKKLIQRYEPQGAVSIKVEVHKHPNMDAARNWAMSGGKTRLTKQFLEWRVGYGIMELEV